MTTEPKAVEIENPSPLLGERAAGGLLERVPACGVGDDAELVAAGR